MSDFTFETLMQRYASARSLSARTVETYSRNLRSFVKFTQLQSPIEVGQNHIRAFYLHLKQQPLSNVTVVATMRGVIVVLRWAARRDLLLIDPTHDFKIPKARRVIQRILTRVEVMNLLHAPTRHLRAFCRLRDQALLELLYGSGIRVGEAAALELADLDLSDRSLQIRVGKGQNRLAPFGEKVATALSAYLEIRSQIAQSGIVSLFIAQHGAELDSSSISGIVRYYGRKLGIPATPHALRRAFATHLLENGANIVEVKNLLGHVDLDSTQVYAQIAQVELTRAHRQSHPRARRSASGGENGL
jgi:site-specific recombinase XerD